MSRRIIGVTVGTPMSPETIGKKLNMSDILPVSNDDNGKVLQVKNGDWVAEKLPTYDGEYVVTPSTEDEQTLLTAGKYIDSNITVEKIPYSETSTSNTKGKTVSIG